MHDRTDLPSGLTMRVGIPISKNVESALTAFVYNDWSEVGIFNDDEAASLIDSVLSEIHDVPEIAQEIHTYSVDLIYAIMERMVLSADIRRIAPVVLLQRQEGKSDYDISWTIGFDEELTNPDVYSEHFPLLSVVSRSCERIYGIDLTQKIRNLLQVSGKAYDTYDFYLLIKNWNEYSAYPIEWSLSLIQNAPLQDLDLNNYY